MDNADTYVRARIDAKTKELASIALSEMGLSVSDAIRMLMIRVAKEHRLPFEVKVPNSITASAITDMDNQNNITEHNSLSDFRASLGLEKKDH